MSRTKYRNLRHRLDANTRLDANGCYVWLGAVSNGGYGKINMRINGRHVQQYVHRVAFEEYVRLLESHEEVDHDQRVCKSRRCINPDHLEAVTRQENLRRRDIVQQKKRKWRTT
jgi:hypothetical protein